MRIRRCEGPVVIRKPLHIKEPGDGEQQENHPSGCGLSLACGVHRYGVFWFEAETVEPETAGDYWGLTGAGRSRPPAGKPTSAPLATAAGDAACAAPATRCGAPAGALPLDFSSALLPACARLASNAAACPTLSAAFGLKLKRSASSRWLKCCRLLRW